MKKDSKAKIANKYASALYMSAAESKAVVKVLKDVESLLSVFENNDSLIKMLSNPVWPLDSKQDALKLVAKKLKLDKESLNFLNLIAENNHFKEITAILFGFKSIYYEKQNIVVVNVGTVKKLNPSQDKKLKTNLEKYLKKKVLLQYDLKPEILGGLVINFADNLLDDSIKGKLDKLELIMKGDK